MQTEHVKYDLMDYITNRLNAENHDRVERHLKVCPQCNNHYIKLSEANNILKLASGTTPSQAYYLSILPRVRERLAIQKKSIWDFGNGMTKLILPLAVSVLLVVFLIRVPKDYFSGTAQTEELHQVVKDLNDDDVVQAIEKEYEGISLIPNQDVAAAGVAEHLQGDQFLKSAVSKQIENEEISDIDAEGIISELDGEQIDQVISGLSERNIL